MTSERPPDEPLNRSPRTGVPSQRVRGIANIGIFIAGCSPLLLAPLIGILSYSHEPRLAHFADFLTLLIFLGTLTPLLLLPFLLVAAIIDRGHQFAATCCFASLLFVILSIVMYPVMRNGPYGNRHLALRRIADNGLPIIVAIEQFERDNDAQSPQSLHDLIPDYLTSVPDTGVVRYNEYIYHQNQAPPGSSHPTSRWLICVPTFDFGHRDSLFYLPDQNYDEIPNRTSYDLISTTTGQDWGYYNE